MDRIGFTCKFELYNEIHRLLSRLILSNSGLQGLKATCGLELVGLFHPYLSETLDSDLVSGLASRCSSIAVLGVTLVPFNQGLFNHMLLSEQAASQ